MKKTPAAMILMMSDRLSLREPPAAMMLPAVMRRGQGRSALSKFMRFQASGNSFHSFRRKFARSYIKNGGNIAYLQHAMGHTTLAMTKHYIGDIPIEDLQMMHQKTSLLGRLK